MLIFFQQNFFTMLELLSLLLLIEAHKAKALDTVKSTVAPTVTPTPTSKPSVDIQIIYIVPHSTPQPNKMEPPRPPEPPQPK